MARAVNSNYTLVLTISEDGFRYSGASIINRRRGTSHVIDIGKHCLQKTVEEKIALLKLVRYDYSDYAMGSWIGANHAAVTLTRDEYKFILGSIRDGNPREKSKGARKKDIGQIPLPL
jgi:hypothetical protein